METSTVVNIVLWSATILAGAYILGFTRGYDAARAEKTDPPPTATPETDTDDTASRSTSKPPRDDAGRAAPLA